MCTRPTQFQRLDQRYPGFITDLLGVWKAVVCWPFLARKSTTVTGPPMAHGVGHGGTDLSISLSLSSFIPVFLPVPGQAATLSPMDRGLRALVPQRHNS